ncbi:unnamed protein product [Rotaria sp. Silwood2]|nr:unnamed protein product [Rotaria sp. Silwood2]CAF2890343.1 unnamed protein product [Rotaria sp. Silwood2]CAF3104748.1 unnamed protein product [Rotaria sp. Silwood2]CAF3277570.1 unnamed protein product [Rotaria sp. Silwood2]CAF4058993.1 unnamed protein product [Rotaria sp. Silwood2]
MSESEDEDLKNPEYQRFTWLNGLEQDPEFYRQLEPELWKQLEKLEGEEETQQETKKDWREECIKLLLPVDEYEENYIENVPENTPVKDMDFAKAFDPPYTSTQQLEHLERNQAHKLTTQPKHQKAFDCIKLNDSDIKFHESKP